MSSFPTSTCVTLFAGGYLQADLDRLGRLQLLAHPELDAAPEEDTERWRRVYCGPMGAEFMHIPYPERPRWVAEATY